MNHSRNRETRSRIRKRDGVKTAISGHHDPSSLFLDSGALDALLLEKRGRQKALQTPVSGRNLVSGKPEHHTSRELKNQSNIRLARPQTVVAYRQKKVDQILGDVFPAEKSLMHGRMRTLESLVTAVAASGVGHQSEDKFPDTTPLSQWSNSLRFSFLIRVDDADIVEKIRLTRALGVSTDTLLRYDLAIIDARKVATNRTEKLMKASHPRQQLLLDLGYVVDENNVISASTFLSNSLNNCDQKLYDFLHKRIWLEELVKLSVAFQPVLGIVSSNSALPSKRNQIANILELPSPILDIDVAAIIKNSSPAKKRLSPIKMIRDGSNNNGDHYQTRPSTTRNTPRSLKTSESSTVQLHSDSIATAECQELITYSVEQNRGWLRDNVPVSTILGTSTALSSSSAHNKQFAVEKLQTLFIRLASRIKGGRMMRWQIVTKEIRCREVGVQYFRKTGALMLLSLARRSLRRQVLQAWSTYVEVTSTESHLEELASAVTIQAFFRQQAAKRYVQHVRERAAVSNISDCWYYFVARRMAVRRRRYLLYSKLARRVQRQYYTYLFRTRFALVLVHNRSTRVIQMAYKCYKARELLAYKKQRKALEISSVIRLQCWYRVAVAKKILEELRYNKRLKNALIIEHAYKSYRIRMVLMHRIYIRRAARNAAARTIQGAYRVMRAHRYMMGLRERLEARRRKEILREMWQRSSATTIQTWWGGLKFKWMVRAKQKQLELIKSSQ